MLELRLLPIVRFLLFILTNRYFFKQKKVSQGDEYQNILWKKKFFIHVFFNLVNIYFFKL